MSKTYENQHYNDTFTNFHINPISITNIIKQIIIISPEQYVIGIENMISPKAGKSHIKNIYKYTYYMCNGLIMP